MIRRFFLVLTLLLCAAAGARATDITVSSFTTSGVYQQADTVVQLRLFYSETFVDSLGNVIVGGPVGGTSFFKSVTCTLNTTTNIVTCPSFTMPSTTDSSKTHVTVSGALFGGKTASAVAQRGLLFSNWKIPTSLGVTVTYAQLNTYNAARPLPSNPTYLNRDEVASLIGAQNYVSTGRTINATSPLRINGGASANLSTDPTFSILDTAFSSVTTATTAGLPAAATEGRLRKLTDGAKDVLIDTGVQWASLTGSAYNVKLFGAKGDDSTNDTAAIQAAINACQAAGGGNVLFPPGAYRYTALTITGNKVVLVGAGSASVLRTTSATGNGITIDNGIADFIYQTGVVNLRFEPAVTRTSGYEIYVPNFRDVRLEDLHFKTVYGGIKLGGPDAGVTAYVRNIRGEGYFELFRLVRVLDLWASHISGDAGRTDGTAIYMDGGCEGNTISHFDFSSSAVGTPTGFGLRIQASEYTASVSNFNKFADGFFDSHLYGLLASDGADFRFNNVWFSNRGDGAAVAGTALHYTFVGCDFVNNSSIGLNLVVGSGHIVSGCSFISNDAGSIGAAGIEIGAAVTGALIVNNTATNATGTLATRLGTGTPQDYGIKIVAGAQNLIITDNELRGNALGAISIGAPSSGSLVIRNNGGFVTEWRGTATVASGATTAVVTHSLGVTPNLYDIQVTPTNNMGTAVKFWVSNITSNQFTINVDAAPGGSGATFAWQAQVFQQ